MPASRTSAEGILATINATALPSGNLDHSGGTPLAEYATLGPAAVFHLLAGQGSTAPYVIGVGVDHDNSPTGVVASVKGNNSIGMAATLESTSGSGSRGLLGQNFSSGELVRLVAGGAASGPLLTLNSTFGGNGNLLQWDTTATDGTIGAAGNMTLTGASAVINIQHAAANQNRVGVKVSSGAAMVDFDHYAGGTSWFASRVDTSGSSLRFRKGTAAAGLGAASYATVLEFKDANAIGFFGATPATPAQRTLPAAGTVTAADIRALLITIGLAQ